MSFLNPRKILLFKFPLLHSCPSVLNFTRLLSSSEILLKNKDLRSMDQITVPKRKSDDTDANNAPTLPDAVDLLSVLSHEDLKSIVAASIADCPRALEAVRLIANNDLTKRKLFVRNLGWGTTEQSLRTIFSPFGELEDIVLVLDKATRKNKGYGFITFKNVDGAMLALKEPSKKIDGRITLTQLAATGKKMDSADIDLRKIYVANVLPEISSERLLTVFSGFGEIEEGPLGFDKQSGKFRGFAFFIYKTAEGAMAAILEPMKYVDGFQLFCKIAVDEKKMGNEGKGGMEFGSGGPMPGMQGSPHHHFKSPLLRLPFMGTCQPFPGSADFGGYQRGGDSGGAGLYGPPSRFSGPGVGGPVGTGRFNGPGMMGSMGSGWFLESGHGPYSVGSIGGVGMQMGSLQGHRMLHGGWMYQGMPPYG